MGRIYTVPYTGTLTAAGGNSDLLSIQPAANKLVKLRGWSLGQSSEVGDAGEESLRITVRRLAASVTIGSGGVAVTPVPTNWADAAAGFTARCNDTTVATTTGADTIIEEYGWNERSTPYEHWYPDERFCPDAVNGQALIVRMESTPADDLTAELTFWIEEV